MLLLALACESLEITNKNNHLWLSYFAPSYVVPDRKRASFQEPWVNTKCGQEEEPVSDLMWDYFSANVAFGRYQPHLVIGPLVSSRYTNQEESLTQRRFNQTSSDLSESICGDERQKKRMLGEMFVLHNVHVSVDKELKIPAKIKKVVYIFYISLQHDSLLLFHHNSFLFSFCLIPCSVF